MKYAIVYASCSFMAACLTVSGINTKDPERHRVQSSTEMKPYPVTPRRAPTLSVAQVAFHLGLDNARFSQENAVKMYANRSMPRAVGVAVPTYKNDAACEIEVFRSDGSPATVNPVPAAKLRPKKEPT